MRGLLLEEALPCGIDWNRFCRKLNRERLFKFNVGRLTKIFDALFAGDSFLRTFASAGVSACALTADRKATAMADTAIASDVFETRDVLIDFAAELTFDRVVFVQQRGDARDFVFAELAGMSLRIDAGLVAKFASGFWTDAVEVRQRNDRWTITRDINTQQTRHELLR
jgi:hypothetical protein